MSGNYVMTDSIERATCVERRAQRRWLHLERSHGVAFQEVLAKSCQRLVLGRAFH
jgi:hypothetical protein